MENLANINVESLLETIGMPREMALQGVEFKLQAHRTDGSRDDSDVWTWRIQTWMLDEDGEMRLMASRIL